MTNGARILAVGLLVAGTIAVVGVIAARGDNAREVTAVVPSAGNLIPGQHVQVGRAAVGEVADVDPVDRGRAARVTLRITDDDYWPLARDTRLEIRLGGTVSYGLRHVLLEPGTAGDELIADGGAIAPANVKVPVEVDEVLAIVKKPLRRDLKRFVDNSGATFRELRPHLAGALEVAPRMIEEASGVLRDLSLDQRRLASLVRGTGSVLDAVDRSAPGMRELLAGTAGTLDAVAAESSRLKTALARMPGALEQVRTTLPDADRTLEAAADLAADLAPGVRRLRRMSAPLSGLLTTLEDVGPDAAATLRTARADSPVITRLLGRVKEIAPQLESIGSAGARELECIRPYTPELVMLTTTWGDFTSPTDGKDRYIRANIQNYFPAPYNNVPLTPKRLMEIYPGLEYGFPRPPGQVADQPWFQPQCGAGPEALDPANDGEAKTFKENQLPPERRR